MVFSINNLKEEIRDTLRAYLYPANTVSTDTEVDLSDNTSVYKIAQSFKPYCKFYSTISPYKYTIPVDVKLRKYGTPDGNVFVTLRSSSDNEPSGTIGHFTIDVADVSSGSLDVNSGSIVVTSMLGSNTDYYICLEPQCSASTVNYYSTCKSSDKYMIGTLSLHDGSSWNSTTGDMYFDITVVNWIYQDFPRSELSKYSFPRVGLDAITRTVNQRWINIELAEYIIDFTIVGYSFYPNELDDILSYVDRALFKERANFTNIKRLDSSEMTPTEVLMDNMFSRALRYNLIIKITNE